MPIRKILDFDSERYSRISGFVAADDHKEFRVIRDVSEAIVNAWLTVKNTREDLDPGVFQKIIGTTPGPDGQITDDGGTSLVAELFFQLSTDDTALLAPTYRPETDDFDYTLRAYDIQVLLASGVVRTLELGQIVVTEGVTTRVAEIFEAIDDNHLDLMLIDDNGTDFELTQSQ